MSFVVKGPVAVAVAVAVDIVFTVQDGGSRFF
jgi:hypothetical protein